MRSQRVFEISKRGGEWVKRTFEDCAKDVLSVAKALGKAGVKREDRVAIISSTRPEWLICDIAIQSAGAITVPIYPNIKKSEMNYIISDSEVKFLFVEKEEILSGLDLKNIKGVVVFDGKRTEGVDTLDDFKLKGETGSADTWQNIKKDDIATLVYTSGTTGDPKGVIQTHNNILSMIRSISYVLKARDDDIIFAWLPFAHTFGRLVIWYSIYNGVSVAYAEGLTKILENLAEIKPTLFPSVPRIYEKAYEVILSRARGSKIKEKIFDFALKVGEQYIESVRVALPPSPDLLFKYNIARKLVLDKIRQAFGGRIRFCISGGASLNPKIAKFFSSAGVLILEGYGLTEACPVLTVNRPDKFKFGSVGLPIPGVRIKIADDGEILAKGPNITRGYWKKPDETRELFTDDGWMKTGDIGWIDDEGFLYITGRKKEIIVTSFGKNVAPAPIETKIQEDPLVNAVAVVGNDRPYLVAIISPVKSELVKFAKAKGIAERDVSKLVEHPEIKKYFRSIIERVNSELPSWQKIAKFAVVPDEWTPETGELTPTLKVKRHLIEKKYKEIIDSLYG